MKGASHTSPHSYLRASKLSILAGTSGREAGRTRLALSPVSVRHRRNRGSKRLNALTRGREVRGRSLPCGSSPHSPGAGRRQTLLVKCWALGKLGRKQVRQGTRNQAFLTSMCPAMLLEEAAGEDGLVILPLAPTSHQPLTVQT